MDTQQLLINIFEHYYSQVHDSNGFRVNKEANQKTIDKFFDLVSEKGYHWSSIGEDFLDNFLRYQFDYWRDKEIERKPTFNWFIGKKAIERYFNVEDKGLSNYWVSLNTSNLTPYKASQNEISDYEIQQRRKFHNTDNGLLYCLENTSLYIKHISCITCKFKTECKTLLKQNYPLLYRRRGLNK